MYAAGALYLRQFTAQACHPFPDHPPVGLDLCFARTAKEAEAAALPFQVGPTAHQTPCLIVQVSKLYLQSPFCSRGTFAEYFKDQAGAINNLGLNPVLQIALLHGRQPAVNDQQFSLVPFNQLDQLFYLPSPQQGCRLGHANAVVSSLYYL
jgi:hypothetical protein